MKGMILAAGFGTRFRPATFEIPKPLVPLCNKPLIDYAVESLLAAGVSGVVVNLHHLPEQLERHLAEHYAGRCAIHLSHESEILGTGGGIRHARRFLEGEESFYLVNGDTIQFPPLAELEARRRELDAVAALLLRHPPAGDRFTKVFFAHAHQRGQTPPHHGLVTGFGSGTGEPLMFSGSHSISSRLFDLLPDRPFSGITEDVYIPLLERGQERLGGLVHDGPWFDIGTPMRYWTASEEVKNLMMEGALETPRGSAVDRASGSLMHDEAEISGEILQSVAGRVRIAAGASVRRSILWDGVQVAASASVESSIVCSGVEVRDGTRIANALVATAREGIEYPEGTVISGGLAAVPIDPGEDLVLATG